MNDWSEDVQVKVQRAAEACPVAKSVHENMEITFKYTF